MSRLVACLLFATASLFGVSYEELKIPPHPTLHDDMGIHVHRGNSENAEVLICCHGFGGDKRLAQKLRKVDALPHHIIGFNFPNYGESVYSEDPHHLVFGSIEELLPVLHLMHESVKNGAKKIHLYGFSAGGGAAVNAVGVLARYRYPKELQTIGIGPKERRDILKAVQQGSLILDCPLKSIDELIADRGQTYELEVIGKRYVTNRMVPVDTLRSLQGLKLNVLLHFQQPDVTLTNRDDALYIETLKKANRGGRTMVVIGEEGKHDCFLPTMQRAYKSFHKS